MVTSLGCGTLELNSPVQLWLVPIVQPPSISTPTTFFPESSDCYSFFLCPTYFTRYVL